MADVLLVLKTLAAAVALAGALVALGVRWLDARHRWHCWGGWVFCGAMAVLALAWLGSALVADSPFRVVAALLFAYPTWSGLRHARRSDRGPGRLEGLVAWAFLAVGIGLFVWATRAILVDEAVMDGLRWFGLATLAVILAGPDVRGQVTTEEDRGPSRIVNHLGMMLAGGFAALMSLLLTLVSTQFAIIGAVMALFITVHLIVHWSSLVLTQGVPKIRE